MQGVAFRASCQRAAARLGVTGHVRNLPDRTVSGEAQAPADRLEEFVAWLHHGPAFARVDRVETTPLEPVSAADAEGFEILR